MAESKKKYEVEIKETKGACDTDLFKMMAKKGDIQAVKIADVLNKVVHVVGYAVAHITTDDKDFDVNYIACDNGLIFSTGSEYFIESLKGYFDFAQDFRIQEVKTKKGKTYKVMPVLQNPKTGEVTELDKPTEDDLPF